MPNLADYCGADGRLQLASALKLKPGAYGVQPKRDGTFVQFSTDAACRISTLFYRNGELVGDADARDLRGLNIGIPNATLFGELEAQTEWGMRMRDTKQGRPDIHVFDVSRFAGEYVARKSYTERYGLLHQWQAHVECYTGEAATREPRNRWRDKRSGMLTRPALKNLARVPIVPLYRGRDAVDRCWTEWVHREGGEGMVCVKLEAPLGAKRSKLKVKNTTELDARVMEIAGRTAVLEWKGGRFYVTAKPAMRVGQVWEVVHDGWYERSSLPRFPRVKRLRTDLCGTVVA